VDAVRVAGDKSTHPTTEKSCNPEMAERSTTLRHL
jgi:hypothetical protein